MSEARKMQGGCHCGAVRFEVQLDLPIEIHECNCSICSVTGFLGLILPKSRFRLIQGQDELSCYTFNTGVAQHLFCRHCGVKSYYIPRSNPDGVSVNYRCFDQPLEGVKFISFDGQNWEQHAGALQHLSSDE